MNKNLFYQRVLYQKGRKICDVDMSKWDMGKIVKEIKTPHNPPYYLGFKYLDR